MTDWWNGDDFHHNGALYLPHAYNFFKSSGCPRPDPVRPEDEPRPLAPNRTDAYKFFLEVGSLLKIPRKALQEPGGFLERDAEASQLRRVLEIARHPAAPGGCEADGHHRRADVLQVRAESRDFQNSS